jgi:hypothetical protein
MVYKLYLNKVLKITELKNEQTYLGEGDNTSFSELENRCKKIIDFLEETES